MLLREHVASGALCYLGTSRPAEQVRSLIALKSVHFSVSANAEPVHEPNFEAIRGSECQRGNARISLKVKISEGFLLSYCTRWESAGVRHDIWNVPLQLREALAAMQSDHHQSGPHRDLLLCLDKNNVPRKSSQLPTHTENIIKNTRS